VVNSADALFERYEDVRLKATLVEVADIAKANIMMDALLRSGELSLDEQSWIAEHLFVKPDVDIIKTFHNDLDEGIFIAETWLATHPE
jgi:hypothetical protein